jgi:hypothetical protein
MDAGDSRLDRVAAIKQKKYNPRKNWIVVVRVCAKRRT